MKRYAKFLLPALLAFHGLVFADTDKDTSYYTLSAGYSGLGLNAAFQWDKIKLYNEENWLSFSIAGLGLGLVQKGVLALSGDVLLAKQLPDNPRFAAVGGLNVKLGLVGAEIIPYTGLIYERWLSTLGYSLCDEPVDEERENWKSCNTLTFNVGYILQRSHEKREKADVEKTAKGEAENPPNKTQYFRAGIELNYPVYYSKDTVAYIFENSFPYFAAGAGLFFRIGPELVYFTTGIYVKGEVLNRSDSLNLSIMGIPIASLPLLEITWIKGFWEFPLLLSFGSGQIRFTGGLLFDFYAGSEFDIRVLDDRQILSERDRQRITEEFEKRFADDIPDGNMFAALGLDIDIVKHWGIGAKFLIWCNAFGGSGEFKQFFEPSPYQVRVFTYLIY